jgi:uncharacterized protein (DUF2236 family)
MEFLRAAIERRVLSLTGQSIGGIDFDAPKRDPGLFGPGSVSWRVHGDFPSMLVGGVSALLLKMLHPQALTGVWDHRISATTCSAASEGLPASFRRQLSRRRNRHGRKFPK